MPGVRVIEKRAFNECEALTYVECGKLEIIGAWAFIFCYSLSSIDLPSIKIVEGWAFAHCRILIHVKFGKELESISDEAFCDCRSLERIALPLKNGMITADDTFGGCVELDHVDLVEGST